MEAFTDTTVINSSSTLANQDHTCKLIGIDIKRDQIFWYEADMYGILADMPHATSRMQPSAHHKDVPTCSW